jgi:hypothetical protein
MLSGFQKLKIKCKILTSLQHSFTELNKVGVRGRALTYLAFKNKDMHFYDIFSFLKKVIGE